MIKIDFSQLNNAKVLLGVSGGVDSMVMLEQFCQHYKGKFSVVTVSHGLREGSLSDCLFVKEYCDKANVQCQIIKADVTSYAKEKGLSIETAARILRRQALVACAEGAIVALAHNACDQAESVIMHILRGSGNKGACGMGEMDEGIFRPLLSFDRQTIEEYAREKGIPFVEDETNTDTSYRRNFLRHKVFPLLSTLNSNYISHLCAFSKRCAQDEEIFENIINVAYAKTMPQIENDFAEIDISLLLMHPSVSSRIVIDIFERIGYFYDVEQSHIDAIISLAKKQTGKSVSLPFGLFARRNYKTVSIEKILSKKDKCDEQVVFKAGKTVYNGQTVVVDKIPDGQMFALDKVPEGACWRTKREGDLFEKFGGGTKKLKEYLIDKKIDARKRDDLILLASANNVLAILGVEISRSLKVEDDSDIYYMRVEKEGQ